MKEGAAPNDSDLERVQEALGWLDNDLGENDYAVGDSITLADIALASTVSTIQEVGIDLGDYGNITAWVERYLNYPEVISCQN